MCTLTPFYMHCWKEGSPHPGKVPKSLKYNRETPAVGPEGRITPNLSLGFLRPISNLTEAGPWKLVLSLFLNLRPRRNHTESLNIYPKELVEKP